MKRPENILDALLVNACQRGDQKALNLLAKRWHSQFCKKAYWYTKDADVAKDIAQDSWNTILFKIAHLGDAHKFGAWSMAIVTRKSIDWLRQQQRLRQHQAIYAKTKVHYEELPEEPTALYDTVRTAIKTLPEGQQLVLSLFYLEGYSLQKIAQLLELSKGTVKSRLFYARERLRTLLKNKNHGYGKRID